MYYVVAHLIVGEDNLIIDSREDLKVATEIMKAAQRIGAWEGRLFGVWEREGWTVQALAPDIARWRRPDSVWVFSSGSLLLLSDEYLDVVRAGDPE
jgi:hypothetical protein